MNTEMTATRAQLVALVGLLEDDTSSVVLRMTPDGVMGAAWDGSDVRVWIERDGQWHWSEAG